MSDKNQTENMDNEELFDDLENEGSEDFAALFEQYEEERGQGLSRHELLQGTIVQVRTDQVIVDVGHKSEGVISLAEFLGAEVVVGQKVDVIYSGEDENGMMRLSKERADRRKVWDDLEEDAIITGKITSRVKGGLSVDIGVNAFLPGSQVDIRPDRNLDKYVGSEFDFKIIKLNRRRGNIVLSRRVILEEERNSKRAVTLEGLEEDKVVQGVVKNLTDYGAFVDLGGIDGLLHVTDMSWGRVNQPSDILAVGDKIDVKVLKYDREKERVSLGLKQIKPDPWLSVPEKFVVSERSTGKVVSLTDYGAFVELEEGVEGLIHVSEMSWTKKVRHPNKVLTVGEEVESVILAVDAENRRISLGLKQTEDNPWDLVGERFPIGTIIEGQVKNITDFGVFIGVDEGIDGLVHVSDLSWVKRIKHPSEIYKKGDLVRAVVLNIDKENERFSLGVKQLSEDPWDSIPVRYAPGTVLLGKVTSVTEFGVFVQLEEGIEGLIHVSEISKEKIDSPKDFTTEGSEVEAVVLNVDTVDRKIALSVKRLSDIKEKAEVAAYLGSQREATSSLGALLQGAMTKNETTEDE